MKFDITEWSFFDLLWEYLEIIFYFKSDEPWEEYPWFTQVELKKIVAVLNAFTGGNYIVETMEGKKKIDEVFAQVSDITLISIQKSRCLKSRNH